MNRVPTALPVTILIGSDVRLYSEGIQQFLNAQPAFRVVGIASRAADILAQVELSLPDVVLLDQALPGSLEALRGVRRADPACRVIALGEPEQDEALVAWVEAGVAGFVPREASVDDLRRTIDSAVHGELHCSARVAAQILRRLASLTQAARPGPSRLPLTAREAEIVGLIDQALSNKEIAVRLGIEVATVKNHVHNLLEKLSVHRRSEAAARLRGRDPRRPTPHGFPIIPD